MLDENGEAIYNPDGTPLFDDMTDAQKAEAAEEFLAFAAETYGVPIDEIYADNRAEIDRWGREHGRDTHDWNEKRRMTREWMAETGFKPERPGWWKQLISQIRVWLAEHGFGHLREADIETIIQDAFRGANRTNRTNRTNGEARYSAEEALKNAFLNEKDADIRQAYPQKTNVEVDAALKDIAGTDLVNRDSNDTAQVNANQARKLVSASAVEKSIKDGTFTRRQHLTAVANIKDLYENAVLIWEGKDEKNEDPNLVVRRFVAPIVFGSDIAGALLTEKMSLNKNNNAKRIYSLELEALFKAEEENLGGHVRLNLPSLSGIERLTHEGFRPDGWNKIERKYEKVKRFLEKNQKKSDGARFSVSPVWTGSAADYEQPDLHYVGTGEGAQVYGWGLYGSSSKNIGRWYAEKDAERKSSHTVTFRGKDVTHALDFAVVGDELQDEGPDGKWKRRALRQIRVIADAFPDYSLSEIVDHVKDHMISFEDGFTYEDWGKVVEEVAKDVVVNTNKASRNLYKQTFWPGREEDLLDWDVSFAPEQARKILDQMEKEKLFDSIPKDEETAQDDALVQRLIYLRRFLGYAAEGQSNISGQTVYETLAKIFKFEYADGDPKAASEFLYRAGIDGVTYIGDSSGVRNYVAFSDKDIRVDEHIRFSVGGVDENLIVVHNVSEQKLRDAETSSGLSGCFSNNFTGDTLVLDPGDLTKGSEWAVIANGSASTFRGFDAFSSVTIGENTVTAPASGEGLSAVWTYGDYKLFVRDNSMILARLA